MDRRAVAGSKLMLVLALVSLGGCGLLQTAIRLVPLAATKLQVACLPEGTTIDTPAGAQPVERLRAGDPIIGFSGETVRILQIHSYVEEETTDFFGIVFDDGARVDLCGMHRILGRRAKHLTVGDAVGQRVVAEIVVYRGVMRSYDLLTEDDGYRINGVPVNSMIEEMYATGRSASRQTDGRRRCATR